MSSLFSTGLSGLTIARTALTTTAQNTANVFTEGYSRQKVVIKTNPANATLGGFIGTGARVTTVERSYDKFLSAQLSQSESSAAGLASFATQIGRLDDLLADRESGLSSLMQTFFKGVQSVADTPADPAARQEMLSTAEALAGKFRSVDRYLTDLNASLNEQIEGAVRQINAIGGQMASLNRQISQLTAATGGQPPNDLLDTRDKLVADLSKLVNVTVAVQDGGQYNLFVGSGQTLVLGERAAAMTAVPSATDPTLQAVALVGVNGQAIELRDGSITGGVLGGALAFRTQSLASARNSVGRLATAFASAFNAQHAQGRDLRGNPGTDLFTLAAPAAFAHSRNNGGLVLTPSIANAGQLSTSDYSVAIEGTAGALTFAVTRLSDGVQVPATVTPAGADPDTFASISFEGITVQGNGAAASAGDSFLVVPTRHAARDLAVNLSDPSAIAAGADDPLTGVSDGRNAMALAGLQRQALVANGTATFNGAYARLVSEVGNKAMEVDVALRSQASLAGQVRASLQAVTGVNQDEETANLLMFQQMYQANAKVIAAAGTMFDTILGLR